VHAPLAPPPVTPIEAYLRRRDWQLAVLVVTLVAVPGALDMFRAAVSQRAQAGEVARSLPVAGAERIVVGRHVRPPRSC
jgi:hypothetical protein